MKVPLKRPGGGMTLEVETLTVKVAIQLQLWPVVSGVKSNNSLINNLNNLRNWKLIRQRENGGIEYVSVVKV